MCAIVGSFNRDKLLELIELNSYRGSHSYSFSVLNPKTGELEVRVKSLGAFEPNRTDCQLPDGYYGIAHIQAPTTDAKKIEDIHPARENTAYLWHNGIIKANHVKVLQSRYGIDTNWDTKLLLRAVLTSFNELNYVDGSYSCLLHDNNRAYLFRNAISPMFYDKNLNISSTKFEGSITTPSDRVLRMDFESKCLYNVAEFKTVENPYFFGDEI